MTVNEIFEELHSRQFVDNYTKTQLTNREYIPLDDAISENYLAILEWLQKNEKKAIREYKRHGIAKIIQISSGIITRNCKSKTSPLYYKYVLKNVDYIQQKRKEDNKEKYDEEEGWED